MQLIQLRLDNFRNYVGLDLKFAPNVNIIYGKNAQGKTNLLEAVAMLALGRSFRTKKEAELIRWGLENCFLRGEFEDNSFLTKIELGLGLREKRAKIDGQVVKSNAVFGQIPVVIFGPDDLQLIKGGPSNRRDFIDLYLAQIEPSYRLVYYDYHKILQQRNRLLKNGIRNHAELETWTEQLVEKGIQVIGRRWSLIESVQLPVSRSQFAISGAKEQLRLRYMLFNQPLEEFLEERIREFFYKEFKIYRQTEIDRRITMVGPHRDDLKITVGNDIDLRNFGSQGQQRTASLSLKLGLVEKIKESRGFYPILLLDDVMSEFDDSRKKALLELLISSVQTFLTSTGRHDFPILTDDAAFFKVEQGEITYVG